MKRKLYILVVLAVLVGSSALAVVEKSYQQLLAEDHAGVINRKPGVVDNRQSEIVRNGFWPLAVSVVNGAGFPGIDAGVKGLRVNLIMGENHSVYGIDVGGFANMATYDAGGLQLALGFNSVGDRMTGFQGASFNKAFSLDGLQLGLYNQVDSGKGCQIGLVNCAEVLQGIQLGLVNYNESASCLWLPIVNVAF